MNIKRYTKEYEPLAKSFKCGNDVIDNFLKSPDALDANQGITYVLLTEENDFIIGFYNIETGRVDQIEDIGGQEFVKPMAGSVNINYLAIDKKQQKMKIAEFDGHRVYLGDLLLHDCEKRIQEVRKQVGATFITVYSTEEGYHLYHDRNGYEFFEDDMSTFVQESDKKCYKLYKYIDDIQ